MGPGYRLLSGLDVRKQLYRSVFSGACGVTYGHHSIWQFWKEKSIYWTETLNRPGARQAGYMRKLMESRPLLNRIPDTTIYYGGAGLGVNGSAPFVMRLVPISWSICRSAKK